eukprot:jgi/Bigna1/71553/fgenesh1_pg.16_\
MPARIKAFQILLLLHRPSPTATTPSIGNSDGGGGGNNNSSSGGSGGESVTTLDAKLTAEMEADLTDVREMIWDPDKGEALAVAVAKVEASMTKTETSAEGESEAGEGGGG